MEIEQHEQKILEQRVNKPGQIGVIGTVVLADGTIFPDVPLAYETENKMLKLSDGSLLFIREKYGVPVSSDDVAQINFPDPKEDIFQPSILQIETTTRCNLHCVFCVGRTFEQERMSLPDFEKILDKFSYQLQEIILQGEGEPFLYEDIFRMIAMAKVKARRVSSISNGHLLDRVGGKIIDSGLDELGFSLESIDPEKFSSLRVGGNFAKFDRNVRDFHRMKSGSGLQTILYVSVLRDTIAELERILEWAESVGFDSVKIQPLQSKLSYLPRYSLPLLQNAISHEELTQVMAQFRDRFGETLLKGFFEKKGRRDLVCSMIREWLYILVNGDVTPCCFIKQNRQDDFGNLIEQPLDEVLQSEHFRAFRENLFSGLIPVDCSGCNLSEPDPTHWQ